MLLLRPMWKSVLLFYWIAALLSLGGCSSSPPYVWVSQLPANDARAPDALRAGDKIQVSVYGQDAMSGEFEIRPAGDVILPVAGSTMVAGKTTEQVAVDVSARLAGALANPKVTVIISARRPTGVSVMGEVRAPGRYELGDGEGVLHALARAGGLTEFADHDAVYVIRTEANRRIRFRYSDLVGADPASSRFQLRNGDVVVVE